MRPCLLLALVLLGTGSARHPHDGRTVGTRLPWAHRGVPQGHPSPGDGPHNGTQFYYIVVTKLRTYARAQRHCQEVLNGQLASVHSAARNDDLQALAKTSTHLASWIGATTTRSGGQWASHWEDSSPWNYANWAFGHPSCLFPTCTTLSSRDGLWRSRPCFQLRPFICQY